MAIRIELKEDTNPNQFIDGLKIRIQEGVIKTWEIDNEGDFTLTSPLWQKKAWFRLQQQKSSHNSHSIVSFGLISSKRYRLTKAVYAVFHARLAEAILACCDNEIEGIQLSSQMDSDIDFI